MIKILFVDDEPNILSGLQRLLRPMRRDWEMTFANGPDEALKILAETPIDVIVSDMKMPGMDGAQLLEKVAELYPNIMRIILSGYSEKEMTVRASGNVHQYLMKPCDTDILKSAVSTVGALQSLINKQETNTD